MTRRKVDPRAHSRLVFDGAIYLIGGLRSLGRAKNRVCFVGPELGTSINLARSAAP